MSKSFSAKEESDSSVVVSEFCETLKWVGLEMEKDCNFSLVLKLEWSNDRLGARNPVETVLWEKLCDKFGSLRTTFDVVVVIIQDLGDWELGEAVELSWCWYNQSFGVRL